MKLIPSFLQRRSFLATFGGATALAATGSVELEAQRTSVSGWQAAREGKDDWLDLIPGKHRMMFDSTTPDAFGAALMFANNFYFANKDGYGLADDEIAVVIVARHDATPFAFNDSIWKKCGATISRLSNLKDPRTSNTYMGSINSLFSRGAHFTVCQMATRELAGSIATDAGGDQEAIFKEISVNLVPNSHLVPAGIVAVNRAQERGYAFVNA